VLLMKLAAAYYTVKTITLDFLHAKHVVLNLGPHSSRRELGAGRTDGGHGQPQF